MSRIYRTDEAFTGPSGSVDGFQRFRGQKRYRRRALGRGRAARQAPIRRSSYTITRDGADHHPTHPIQETCTPATPFSSHIGKGVFLQPHIQRASCLLTRRVPCRLLLVRCRTSEVLSSSCGGFYLLCLSDWKNITTLFEFGFELSCASFKIEKLRRLRLFPDGAT